MMGTRAHLRPKRDPRRSTPESRVVLCAKVASAIAFVTALAAPPAAAQQPALRVYSIRDGLKFSQVMCVLQDRRGFVWAGTSYGVSRYDGREFASLTKASGLPHDTVLAMAEDAEGFVWLVTQAGLARVAPMAGPAGNPQVVPVPPALAAVNGPALQYIAAGGDALWAASETTLHRLRAGGLETWDLAEALGGRLVSLGPADASGIWLCSGRRVVRLQDGKPTKYTPMVGLGPAVGLVARGSELLLLQAEGLARMNGASFVSDPGWGLPRGIPTRAALAFGERLVVLTEGADGFFLLTRGRPPQRFTAAQGLPSDMVSAAALDRDGLLWLATEDGLVKIFDFAVRSFPSHRPELGPLVLSVAREPGGPLWIGHAEGVGRIVGDRPERVDLSAVGSPSVWGILPLGEPAREAQMARPAEAAKGRSGPGLLLATRRGLVHLRGTRARRFPTLPLAGSDRTYDLARDPEGRIWASAQKGVVRFRWDPDAGPADAQVFDSIGGEPFGEARKLAFAADGTLWIGTDGDGVVRWDGREMRRFRDGFPTGVCRVILPRPEGVWVGTDSGLFLLDDGRLRALDDVNRVLDDRYVVSLAPGHDDSVWLATSYSVLRVRAGRVEEAFDFTRGLVGSSTTSENGLAVEGDTLWIGTDGGLTGVDVGGRRRTEPEPDAMILAAADAAARRVGAGARLTHSSNSVTFLFRSPTFVAEERTRFQERLVGYDADWSAPHVSASQRYTNLPPGDYELRVRAVTPTGRTGRTASLPFTIRPAWWQTLWADLGGLAALGLATHAFARWRTRQLRGRAVDLERLVTERTLELAESTRQLEQAQLRVSELLETSHRAQEDVAAWAQATGAAVARALGAVEIAVFAVDGDRATPLGETATTPPDADELRRAASGEPPLDRTRAVVPVRGPTGEALAALVVVSEAGRRPAPSLAAEANGPLLSAFAHQLGGALEMRRVRAQLASAESARTAVARDMQSKGIETLRVCPVCQRCFGQDTVSCPDDGARTGTPHLLPYRVVGRYRLERILGGGGMGTVFLAQDEQLGREVAVKLLRPEHVGDPGLRLRIEREAHAIASIQHPSVVALFDAGTLEDGSLFLVIERLVGCDLADVLTRFGRGRPAQVGSLLRQAASGLGAAHRVGVVHRDVKPQNLFLVDDPGGFRVKVVDFGLAKSLREREDLTRTGMLVGTPAYMSPEQVAGRAVTAASDLYSLAAVGHEALTGCKLVAGSSLGEMFSEVLLGVAPPPSRLRPGLPPAADDPFSAALAKDPAARPASIEAWAESLAATLEAAAFDEPGWPEPLGQGRGAPRATDHAQDAATGAVQASAITDSDDTRG